MIKIPSDWMIMVIIYRFYKTVIYCYKQMFSEPSGRNSLKKESGQLAAIRVNLNMRRQSQLFEQDEARVLMTKNE